MVGIGGSGMSSVAAVLVRRGAFVSGTDLLETAVLDHLRDIGVRIVPDAGANRSGERRADLVVASAAIPADHETLVQARRDGIPVIKYARLLGELMRRRDGIAVSGTHGKSTTSAWLAFVLRRAGLDPTFVIGAHVEQLGGSGAAGDGPHFVAEACEFDRSFLNLHPRSAAILNIEEDHLDCYGDLAAIVDSFRQFAASLPDDGLLVLNGHDPNCTTLADQLDGAHESFGLDPEHDWAATELSLEDGCYEFTLARCRETFGRVRIGIPGRHNVLNALAVCALATRAGVERGALLDALPLFSGAQRRMQVLGCEHGVTIADDYAHHPTEIRATLEAARERFSPHRVWCVFQPHQHSRTRRLLAEFASSLDSPITSCCRRFIASATRTMNASAFAPAIWSSGSTHRAAERSTMPSSTKSSTRLRKA